MHENNITVIGAGVVGLAVAYGLSNVGKGIIVVEKNGSFGQETSSRNSEVIHAGLYYLGGSLKAMTCIRGNKLLYEFCARHNIPHKKLGKLVVACDQEEIKKIEAIYKNGEACGVEGLRFLDDSEIRKLEPDIQAKKAFFSSESGIIDSHSLMKFFYQRAKQSNIDFSFATEVVGIDKHKSGYKVTVKEPEGESFSFSSDVVINAAGLYSDKIAEMAGIDTEKNFYKLHYCKGQYFRLKNPEKFSIKHLVYPPATKIDLGIHITPDLGGGLRLGPDAKYLPEIDYNIDENSKEAFYTSVKKFLSTLKPEDLIPDTVGVRPKLQTAGEDFRDFVIQEESDRGLPGFINLIGIESPGLTSCLAIAEIIRNFVKQSIFP